MYEFDALMGDWTYKLEVTAIATQVRTSDLLVFSGYFLICFYLFWFAQQSQNMHQKSCDGLLSREAQWQKEPEHMGSFMEHMQEKKFFVKTWLHSVHRGHKGQNAGGLKWEPFPIIAPIYQPTSGREWLDGSDSTLWLEISWLTLT